MRMGIPRMITTDNGKEFKNNLDDELSKQLGVTRIFTTLYHLRYFRKPVVLDNYFLIFTGKWT